jgi:hypothetical protein
MEYFAIHGGKTVQCGVLTVDNLPSSSSSSSNIDIFSRINFSATKSFAFFLSFL